MKKYLIIGLENSCSKILSVVFYENLKIKSRDKFKGIKSVSDGKNLVQHYSLPWGQNLPKDKRDFYPDIKEEDWDHIIIASRDFNCSLKSKIKVHQPNKKRAIEEQLKGQEILKKICSFKNSNVFSYESWFLLGDEYLKKFLSNYDIKYTVSKQALNVNKKHIK